MWLLSSYNLPQIVPASDNIAVNKTSCQRILHKWTDKYILKIMIKAMDLKGGYEGGGTKRLAIGIVLSRQISPAPGMNKRGYACLVMNADVCSRQKKPLIQKPWVRR